MNGRGGKQADRPAWSATASRRWLPFWVLQASELAVAVVFVDISVHVANGGLLIAAAAALALLALTARGPLGIVRICGQPLHVLLVLAVAAMIAIAPIVPALRPDFEGIIVAEFGAIGLIRLATFAQSSGSPSGARGAGRPEGTIIDASATVTVPRSSAGGGADPGPGSTDGTPPGPERTSRQASTGAAARWLGRTAGAATATSRRSAARYRPGVEDQLRRTIRGAGRITGRLTSKEPGDTCD